MLYSVVLVSAIQCESAVSIHISRRRKWQPTPVFLPGKSHGRRSLVGYSRWSHNESDTTEHARTHRDYYNQKNKTGTLLQRLRYIRAGSAPY